MRFDHRAVAGSFGLVALFLAGSGNASATPVACTAAQPTGPVSLSGGNSCQLQAEGQPITAVFIYANAALQSTLSLPSAGMSAIFQNNSPLYPFGSAATLTVTSGQLLDFTLTNQTGSFVAGSSSADGVYHAAYRDYAHYSDFNDPAIDPSVLAVLNFYGGPGSFTFVAFEDTNGGGDRDYNDLVFAFNHTLGITPVPEPATIVLLSTGLGGVLLRRRSRRK